MPLKKVQAIVHLHSLEKVESALQDAGVQGITVTRVKGFGDYKNFFSSTWLTDFSLIDIFTSRADEIADIIMQTAHSGDAGDGIIAIMPVEKLVRIREKSEISSGND